MARKGELRRLLAGGEQIVAPGVFDNEIDARLAAVLAVGHGKLA